MTTVVQCRRSSAALARARNFAAAAAALTLAACDFPTELPIFEPRLVVEAERTTLSVSQLLPSDVTISGSNFSLRIATPAPQVRTLSSMCSACPPAGGTGPKVEFTATIPSTTNLPSDVRTANLVSGSVAVTIANNLGFDPLRPPGGPNGSLVITVRSGTVTLGSVTYTNPLPAGNTTLTLPVTGTVSGPITADAVLTSPAGGTSPSEFVTVSSSASITVSVAPASFLVSTATVGVTNKTVSVSSVTLDLSDIDADLADRVKEGALVLTIANPFGVTGTLNVTFTGVSVGAKSIALAAGTSTQRIAFTGAEIKQLLGRDVVMNISGPVSGPATGVTVTPNQALNITSKLDLTLTTKTDN